MKQNIRLVVFLLIVTGLVLGLLWYEQRREPVQFSDVFFSMLPLSQIENKA